ncbi:MAG: BlaI/MecI/CopY family transcriptional regulator [Oscillospiraceae bacterium]|nr:BlaI/MecI/CopY family transcriptional regulator [Oscillospiraceae bacterium]
MKINNSELKFMEIIWENEPVSSGDAVKLSSEILGWKKSTVYTVIKKLCEKNILESENAILVSKVSKETILEKESKEIVNEKFSASLPMFLASFMKNEKISPEEAEELKELIDRYTREG